MISGIILFTNFDVYAVLGVENIVFIKQKRMLIYAILAVNLRVFYITTLKKDNAVVLWVTGIGYYDDYINILHNYIVKCSKKNFLNYFHNSLLDFSRIQW